MKAVNLVRKIANIIIVALFTALICLVLMQIVCRLLMISQTWIDEVSKFIFVWLVYMGGSVTVSKGMNITFDLILESTKGKNFKVLFTVVNLSSVVFLAAMMILGTQNAWTNRLQVSSMTHTNVGLMNMAIPVGCVLMIAAQIEYYFRTLRKREGEEAR